MFYFFIALFIVFETFGSEGKIGGDALQPLWIESSTGLKLEMMPVEILKTIADHLPIDSLLNLRSTSNYCYIGSQIVLKRFLTNHNHKFNLSNNSFPVKNFPLEEKSPKNKLSILLQKSTVINFSLHLSLTHFCMRVGKLPKNLDNIKGLNNRMAFYPFKYGDQELTYLKYAPIRHLHLIGARLNTRDFRHLMKREPGQTKKPFADLKQISISLPRAKNFTGLIEFLSHYADQLTYIHLSEADAFKAFIQFLRKEKKIFNTTSLLMPVRVPLEVDSPHFKRKIKNVFTTLTKTMPTLHQLKIKTIIVIDPEIMNKLIEVSEKIAKTSLRSTVLFTCDY